ncbi:MAG: DNA adenine methylase [Eubacterium sp.]|nr:DNA adenine methylase [Eubacterium sp.]
MEFMSACGADNKCGISQNRVSGYCSKQKTERKTVKPFLKWAGGKGQLLGEIEKYYPFENKTITKYAEPFVGGGAVLFDILSKYDLDEVYISDINAELINAYCVIRDEIDELVETLSDMQNDFLSFDTDKRKIYYMQKRERFNCLKVHGGENSKIEKAAFMIFLNKTCFNGLFRVNKKGLFNVPMGAYKNPLICDERNLRAVSESLQRVTIVCGDYRESADFIDEHTFVYFDPPYRPITDTASFTAYTEHIFNDKKQMELAKFIDEMHRKSAKALISNSDPKNSNSEDNFFDQIYFPYKILQVEASRMINCNSDARGKIKELLISNF